MISQETLEAVKHQVSIISVIGERLKLERRGRVYLGLCPFHKEKTPSFNVNEEKGFYHCFGCHESGNAISFIRKLDGLSFPEAVRALAEQAGIEFKEDGSSEELKQEAEARRRRLELYEACTVAADYFERCLTGHPLSGYANAELERRDLTPSKVPGVQETLKAFRVGYAPYGWEGLVAHLRRSNLNLRAAEAVGLIGQRKSGGGYYDRFRHRLMFAVLDLRGRVVAFSGRSLEEPDSEELARESLVPATGEPPPKYYNSPESPIYRKREEVFGLFQAGRAVRSEDSCVLVEGNFDVVSLHARGIGNVAAPLGTAFTPQQARQVQRYSHQITLLFDGDAAGQRATRAAREPCKEQGLRARVATLPKGKDPDDLIREGGPEAIQRLLGGARPLLEYLIDGALESGFSAGDAQGRALKIKEVGELIAAEQDPVVRAMAERHADGVAGRLGIIAGEDVKGFRAYQLAMDRASARSEPADRRRTPGIAPPERARSPSRIEAIAEHILGAALEYPGLLEDPDLVPALDAVEGALALALVALRKAWAVAQGAHADALDAHQSWEPEGLSKEFPEVYRNLVLGRLTAPQIETEEAARGVLRDNLAKVARLNQRREQAGVVQELIKASAIGDTESEMSLLEKQLARARARHGLT